MNIIFGIWRPKGATVEKAELNALAGPTERFAADGLSTRIAVNIGMGSQAHYTDDRSRLDVLPAFDVNGRLLVFDGRLDNYTDLQRELHCDAEILADSDIVLRAYQRWGCECFARFIGDWSLCLWDAVGRTLYLARDHAGSRTLYYSRDAVGTVIWATYLDSFLVTEHLQEPDSHYMASYLAMLPVYRRSPYRDIQSIVPGHFLAIREERIEDTQFWTPIVNDQIVYKSDGEYQSHFLHLLEQSVARRDGRGAPRLAQLSGGMDSTSIVCLSDKWRKAQQPTCDLIDTVSYFDDSEPSWNERPYFTLVEARRGKTGIHLDAARNRSKFEKPPGAGALYLYPGIDQSNLQHDVYLRTFTKSPGFRSVLSGIGGDELTGGIPNPTSELVDHLVAGRLATATHRAIAWSLANRTCLVDCLAQSVRFFADHLSLSYLDESWSSIPWLTTKSREICHASVRELPIVAYRPFSTRPGAIDSCQTWWYTLRTQPHLKPSEIYRYEFRYPYLDRDLVDYLLRVPQEQLSRPGRRRAMMRSALVDIVPNEILERSRKAFLLKTPLAQISALAPRFQQLLDTSVLVDGEFIDRNAFRQALDNTITGRDLRWWGLIRRTIGLETWLAARSQQGHQRHSTQICVTGRQTSVA
jgi:asparagine synthase (glutamine-hydrolysing)